MVLLAGINIDGGKLVKAALESFYGIGPKVSQRLMAQYFIAPREKLSSLQEQQILELNGALANMKLENDLRRDLQAKIKRLKEMGTYRGRRHVMGLPVRGQRTRNQITTARRLNREERKG